MDTLSDEIARRRTFAIIPRPDAGKTTLTEKLLLFGGAIQLADEVKARGDRRRARSDWMAIERERGVCDRVVEPEQGRGSMTRNCRSSCRMLRSSRRAKGRRRGEKGR